MEKRHFGDGELSINMVEFILFTVMFLVYLSVAMAVFTLIAKVSFIPLYG